jgi:hypothetical protein
MPMGLECVSDIHHCLRTLHKRKVEAGSKTERKVTLLVFVEDQTVLTARLQLMATLCESSKKVFKAVSEVRNALGLATDPAVNAARTTAGKSVNELLGALKAGEDLDAVQRADAVWADLEAFCSMLDPVRAWIPIVFLVDEVKRKVSRMARLSVNGGKPDFRRTDMLRHCGDAQSKLNLLLACLSDYTGEDLVLPRVSPLCLC